MTQEEPRRQGRSQVSAPLQSTLLRGVAEGVKSLVSYCQGAAEQATLSQMLLCPGRIQAAGFTVTPSPVPHG